jgi:hypothetical protein
MAMNFTTIRNTNQETIIHFETDGAYSGTITLDTDLTNESTQERNADTPLVNIVRFVTTGELGSLVVVSRDGKNIIACAPENAPFLDLTSMGISDGTQHDQDIVIANVNETAVSGYITLRKLEGWSTFVENETYGAYDDKTRVGARTDVRGSPDFSG